jgi:hypothetical protein
MNMLTFSRSIKKILGYFLLMTGALLILSCGAKLVSSDLDPSPDSVQLTKIAEGQIELTWEYNDAGGDTVTYYISRKTGGYDWLNYLDFTDNKYYVDYIPTSTTVVYSYQIHAYNYSTGVLSPPSEIVAYFSEYTFPTDIEVDQISQDELEITWVDNSFGEEGFYIDKRITGEDWINKYRVVGSDVTSFIDFTDLYEEITYRVKAFSGITNTPAIYDTITATLLPPSHLILEKPDNQQIRITWQDNSDTETGFYIDKKVGETEWIIDYQYIESPDTTFIDDIELPCGDFTYRVRAVEDIYSSPYSEEASINIFLDLIGDVNTNGNATKVFISEETNWYVLISDLYNGIALIDCVNPHEPQNQNYNEEGLPDRTVSVSVKDNMAYVTTLSGLEEHGRLIVIDLSTILPFHGIDFPDVLYIAANVPVTGNPDDTFVPYDIFIDGNYAYIADGENGLEIMNISSTTPVNIANFQTGGTARKVYVYDGLAYVSTGFGGVVVVDVTTPGSPILANNYPTTAISLDATERDGYLFIADGENGLKIVNMATEAVSYVNTGGFANSVYVQGQGRIQEDHVYLLDREQGLYVIDITDISNPYILGTYEMDSEPVSISKFFHSSYVFIADNVGLKIVQVAP